MPGYAWRCLVCDSSNAAGTATCSNCESPAELPGVEILARREARTPMPPEVLEQRSLRQARWAKILMWSLPGSLVLQVAVPVAYALLRAPVHGLLCTATLHGERSVPCNLPQLIGEWLEVLPWLNAFLLGAPTLLGYLLSVVVLWLAPAVSSTALGYMVSHSRRILAAFGHRSSGNLRRDQ
jgi:hypothetical protein